MRSALPMLWALMVYCALCFARTLRGDTVSSRPDGQEVQPYLLRLQALLATAPFPQVHDRPSPPVVVRDAGVGSAGNLFSILAVLAWLASMPMVAAARDDGPTLPIESVLAERQGENPAAEMLSDMAVAYPVENAGLRRGRLLPNAKLPAAYAVWLTHPLALIADDEPSRRWLTQQADALASLGASVLVVRVMSVERMRSLRALRPELPMAPAHATELVEALQQAQASVLPLVILSDGRLTQDVR